MKIILLAFMTYMSNNACELFLSVIPLILMCLFLLICFHRICKTFLLPICVVASATIDCLLLPKNECSIHNSIMSHMINNKGICSLLPLIIL